MVDRIFGFVFFNLFEDDTWLTTQCQLFHIFFRGSFANDMFFLHIALFLGTGFFSRVAEVGTAQFSTSLGQLQHGQEQGRKMVNESHGAGGISSHPKRDVTPAR